MSRLVRALVLAAFCLPGWAAGTVVAAGSAAAAYTPCPNGSSTCPPNTFGNESGTLLATTSGTFTASDFTATYTESVYSDPANAICPGCLDFDVQVSNQAKSANAIERVTVSNFAGTTSAIGYSTSGGSASGGGFVNGSVAPTTVGVSNNGSVISWYFNSSNELPPGSTTELLEVQTGATQYQPGLVSAQNGGAAQGTGFQPVTPSANIAEAGWVPGIGLLGGGLAGVAVLRRRRGAAALGL